jgi:hypothetical protein
VKTTPQRSLTDLWPELGTDERLAIMIEQLTVEVRRLASACKDPGTDPRIRARVAGYATAVADIRYYVVEGNPPPIKEMCDPEGRAAS